LRRTTYFNDPKNHQTNRKGAKKEIMKLTFENRFKIATLNQFICHYCDNQLDVNDNWAIDHIYPKALGGKDKACNYILSCKSCNSQKRSIPLSKNDTKLAILKAWKLSKQLENLTIELPTTITTIRIPETVHEALRNEAFNARESLNQLIIDVLTKHVKEEK
jgi:5-methylcytosine-specific restriction endonuclease McrA